MFVLLLTYVRPLAEVDALMREHVAWLDEHYAAGRFLVSGRRIPRTGGVIVARGDDRHWTCGDRGVSEWTIRGTQVNGERIEVRGCDLFEFTDGKISRKDSFWKIVG